MSKHFCFCIPVRVAVFFFSLLTLLSSGLAAALAWFILFNIEKGKTVGEVDFGEISTRGRIAVIVSGSIFTLIALVSLFGFLGAVFRKRRFVKLYSVFTWFIFLFTVLASGFFYYVLFSGRNLFKGCKITDGNGDVRECRLELPLWQKIVSSVVTAASIIVSLYIAIVINRYVEQLYDEHDEHKHGQYKLARNVKNSATTYEPSYYPPTAQDHQGLLNPHGAAYPYTDASHSFGARA